MTYGYLMERFGLTRGRGERGVVRVLGEIQAVQAAANAPGLAPIVARKDTGYPGGGFFCWRGVPASIRRPRSRGTDPRLSEAEKRYVSRLRERVWRFYGAP